MNVHEHPTYQPEIKSAEDVYMWYKIIGLDDSFADDHFSTQQIENMTTFAFRRIPFDVLMWLDDNVVICKAAAIAARHYDKEVRKANGDPYFKHVLRASLLCVNLHDHLDKFHLSQEDFEVMVAAELLHDVIEITRDNRIPYTEEDLTIELFSVGISPGKAARITEQVKGMTPDPSKPIPEEYTIEKRVENWRERKLHELSEKIKPKEKSKDNRIFIIEKIADVIANAEESLADWDAGIEVGFDNIPAIERLRLLRDRLSMIQKHVKKGWNPFFKDIKKLQQQLQQVIDLLNAEQI